MENLALIDLTELDGDGKYTVPDGSRVVVEITKATLKNGVTKNRPWYLVNLNTEVRDEDGENEGKWVFGGYFLRATNPELEAILTWNEREIPIDADNRLDLNRLLELLVGCQFGCTVINTTREKKRVTLDPVTGDTVEGDTYTVTDNKVQAGSEFDPF